MLLSKTILGSNFEICKAKMQKKYSTPSWGVQDNVSAKILEISKHLTYYDTCCMRTKKMSIDIYGKKKKAWRRVKHANIEQASDQLKDEALAPKN